MLITDAIIPMLHNSHVVTAAGSKKLIVFYDGPMPTEEQFKAAMYSAFIQGTTRGQFNLASFNTWITGTIGATVRGHAMHNTTLTPRHLSPKKFSIPLSESAVPVSVVASGNVGWFLIAAVVPTATSYNQNAIAYWMGIGTVGDIGSNSDLQLPGASVNTNDVLKANDLVFNYTGV